MTTELVKYIVLLKTFSDIELVNYIVSLTYMIAVFSSLPEITIADYYYYGTITCAHVQYMYNKRWVLEDSTYATDTEQ